jgi:hypothetical protein
MTGWPLVAAMMVVGCAICCSRCARAGAAERALAVLCPKASVDVELVEAEAHRRLLHPALVVAVIAHESRCSMSRRGRLGEIGYGQIKPDGSAARGFSREELETERGNLAATARHLARVLTICNGFGGLSIYAGHRQCKSTQYSRAVLAKWLSTFSR